MNHKASEYLKRYKIDEALIETYEYERKSIYEEEAKGSGIDYAKDKVQTSASDDGLFRTVERIEKRVAYLDKAIEFYRSERKQIRAEIRKAIELVPAQGLLLWYYYINDMDLAEAVERAGYSRDNASRIHGYALETFEKANQKGE